MSDWVELREQLRLTSDEENDISKNRDDFIRAWDPDFTKLTPEEKEIVDRSDAEMKAGIYYTEDEVWD